MQKLLLFLGLAFLATPFAVLATDEQPLEEVILTSPPNVPPAITRTENKKLKVNLEIIEVKKRLADGVEYNFWTFGGTVPGKMIRALVGDSIEFHLSNDPANHFPHNIDLHAVSGPGGGASASLTNPGHTSVFTFQLLNPGLYIYHCATAPIGMHIGSGMYGLIYVQPKGGLPPVDHEYYIVQGDFYTTTPNGTPGTPNFSMDKALAEKPDYVLFNGSVGALLGDNALQAKVGEKIRLFIGNGGPNLTSSFHVIGTIFDKVYAEGGTALINENVQTTVIPPGGAAIVELTPKVPGDFLMVDHAITRAFNKGAMGVIHVTGDKQPDVYSGKQNDLVYLPEGATIQKLPEEKATAPMKLSLKEKIAKGKDVFGRTCLACHQQNGQGLPGAFPPLAKSDFLNANKERAVKVVLNGLTGPVTVNGQKFNSVMPAQVLNDAEIAYVLTFVYSQWGNKNYELEPEQVTKIRSSNMPGH